VYSSFCSVFSELQTYKSHEDSDIDPAIVLDKALNTFETEVKLMCLRKGDETLIEPHLFDKKYFVTMNPFIKEIISKGIKINPKSFYD